jgi:predicted transport protein
LLASLEDYVVSLGDDVQRKELKLYLAFKRLKNFATVVAQKNRLLLYLHLNPEKLSPLPAIGRDVSQQGHWGRATWSCRSPVRPTWTRRSR